MEPIKTNLTRLLNITTPIISAPMAFATTAELAAATSKSGGFGFIGAGFDTTEELKTKLQKVRTSLNIQPGQTVPVGVGFICWILDKTESSDDPRLLKTLDEKHAAIWFAFGDVGKYVATVREHEAKQQNKTPIFVIVNSVEEAQRAAVEWKVDVLVLQGDESGGHGGSESPPLFDLLPAVLKDVQSDALVVAAGGISTGSQIAALLSMGADGVVLGTRFLFSHECCYSDAKKAVLLKAGLNDTVRTLAYDDVGRTSFWPAKTDGRAIRNDVMTDMGEGLSLEERLKRFDESAAKGDSNRLIVWAGVGVGLVNSMASTAEIVHELHSEALRTLRSTSRFF